MRLLSITAALVFLIDQVIKYYVVHILNLPVVRFIEVYPPFLNLTMAWNHGINFGLFANQSDALRWALIGIAVAICIFVLWWMRRETNRWAFLSGGFLIGGALGNIVDRVLYGAVADFLNMSCCGIVNPFAFNVADCAIFVGAIGLVIFASDGKDTGPGKRSRKAKA